MKKKNRRSNLRRSLAKQIYITRKYCNLHRSNLRPTLNTKTIKIRSKRRQKRQICNWKDLHIALDEVKRSDGRVSETAAEDPADGTSGVECRGVHLYLPWLARCRNNEAPPRRGWSSRRRGGCCRSIESRRGREGCLGGVEVAWYQRVFPIRFCEGHFGIFEIWFWE